MNEYRQHRFTRPPGATEILLVRHGESRAYVPGAPFPLVNGHGDPELSDLGRAQAVQVGERLRGESIDAIYVTNLRRTVETAAPLSELLTLAPQVEADLREVHLGEWEGGILRIKAYEADPVYLKMNEQERWDLIPGAESWEHVHQRVTAGLERIVSAHPNQRVAAFVHGGIVAHILAHATGSRHFAFNGADNGSISHIVVTPGRILVRSFNDASHLEGLVSEGLPT